MSAQNLFKNISSNPKIKIFSPSPATTATKLMISNLPRISKSMLFLFYYFSSKTFSTRRFKILLSFFARFIQINQLSTNANMKETFLVLSAYLNI
jgi:hypothetical protein